MLTRRLAVRFSDHGNRAGGTVLAGVRPNFIVTPTPGACCARCLNRTGCTTWVREPSTGHCWLIQGGRPKPNVANRTVGFVPPPPLDKNPTVFLEAYGNISIRIRLAFGAAPPVDVLGALRTWQLPPTTLLALFLANVRAAVRLASAAAAVPHIPCLPRAAAPHTTCVPPRDPRLLCVPSATQARRHAAD